MITECQYMDEIDIKSAIEEYFNKKMKEEGKDLTADRIKLVFGIGKNKDVDTNIFAIIEQRSPGFYVSK